MIFIVNYYYFCATAQPIYPQGGGAQAPSWPGREPGLPGYPAQPQSAGGVYPQVPNGGQYPAWSNPGYAPQGPQGYAAPPNTGYGYPTPYGAPAYGAPGNSAGGFAPPPSMYQFNRNQSRNSNY